MIVTASRAAVAPPSVSHARLSSAVTFVPGLGACLAVAAAARGLQAAQDGVLRHVWLEALVLAIVLGAVVRLVWTPGDRWRPGVTFSAKFLLEVAVVLLGATVSATTLMAIGPALLAGIMAVIVASLALSWGVGRLLGLSPRMTILIACGNAICGNSAIAAVAPIIGADGDEVTAAIGFTALLGVVVVLGLPSIGVAMHMSAVQFGTVAGLTVYAVPQVVAAAAPMGPVAIQFGTLVKLVRVLMLGPVCSALALIWKRGRSGAPETPTLRLLKGASLFPWFIAGFLTLIALRSLNVIPARWTSVMSTAAIALTVVAMAGLGLSTDLKSVSRSGLKVSAAVLASTLLLAALSFFLVWVLRLS